METVLMAVHLLVAVLLIGVVLIQRGQGADMGSSFGGGGAQTLFGSRGSGSFLGKATGGLAAVFMMTSLSLAFFTQQQAGSVVEQVSSVVNQVSADAQKDAPVGFDPATLKGVTSKPSEDTLPAAE
ncbi:MAG: preprotein translocase subunit SecG [Mariprofundaceae bacterium]|nr:preprotein translocase subunit SecG [Mariprofundaceae bacterium]